MGQEKQAKTRSGWSMIGVTIMAFLGVVLLFVMFGWIMAASHGFPSLLAGTLATLAFIGAILLLLTGGVAQRRLLYGSAQPSESDHAVRLVRGHGAAKRMALGQPFLLEAKGVAPTAQPQRREAQGERQARQPDRNRGRGRLARDTTHSRPCFDVENYEAYVHIQSESAVRHLASSYAYDHGEEHEQTLRSSVDEVCAALQKELQERVAKAGVVVDEARLTHLAYAPEIAGVMLRRQQAEAIIDARQKIVHGAVSMVKMALHDLAEQEVIQLDEERKASMVSNLLVVLCGEKDAQPIINAGTLYT